jgi:hypothetical protein
MPAYAGLISSVGLGFLMRTAYLLPLTVLSLALALAALGFRAGRRRGYGPLAVGVAAAGLLVVAKFLLAWDTAVYAGIAALVGASLWNSWPLKPAPAAPGAPTGAPRLIGSIEEESDNGNPTEG